MMNITKAIEVLKDFCKDDVDAVEAVITVEKTLAKANQASSKQVYAINKIAEEQNLQVDNVLAELGITGPLKSISKTDASKIITHLKS